MRTVFFIFLMVLGAGAVMAHPANRPPVLEVERNIRAKEGPVSLLVKGEDAEGDSINFRSIQLPKGASGKAYWVRIENFPNRRTFRWDNAGPVGKHSIRLCINDQGGNTTCQTAVVTIQPPAKGKKNIKGPKKLPSKKTL